MGATVLNGKFSKVTYGTTKILGAGRFSLSGLTRKTIDASEFGDDIDIFEFSTADGGTISITDVLYDPTDSTGQALVDALIAGSLKSLGNNLTSGLRFYINSTSYRQVGTSGHILITGGYKLDIDRNGLAKCGFEGKVSGAPMILY
ncbi:MAG: hypothetical protein ABIJ57_17195 [Pseudomonadota bacterium]